MGWGTLYGTGWGGCDAAAVTAFTVASARATSSKTYVVTFTQNPLILSAAGANDASNLANVELVRLDTLEVITLLAGGPIAGSPQLVEYVLLGEFMSPLIVYETRHTNLISTVDGVLEDPKEAQFDGMPNVTLPREQLRPLLDYFNPQAEGDFINGGLVVGTNSDYQFESGVTLMRKLIIRRITTAQDAFFHLSDREYGLGVQSKRTYTESDLIFFKRQLEREVQKEPEIRQSSVTLVLKASHELIITVRAQLQTTNQQIEVSLPLDLTAQTTVIA